MAKRELSSTLKNLKFMQRAAQKEGKPKQEEQNTPAGDFPSSSVAKRCLVIMEGDPPPGATSGRMSFLSFNPSVDKLNQEASGLSENKPAATNSGRQNESIPMRENASSQYSSDNLGKDSSSNATNGELKRKQAEVAEAQFPNKASKNEQGNHSSSPASSGQKKQKHGKLDWSVLRPPKPQSKKR